MNRTATPKQATCTAPIVELPDGSLGCPECGWIAFTAEELASAHARRGRKANKK